MEESRIRKEKVAFSNEDGLVWKPEDPGDEVDY